MALPDPRTAGAWVRLGWFSNGSPRPGRAGGLRDVVRPQPAWRDSCLAGHGSRSPRLLIDPRCMGTTSEPAAPTPGTGMTPRLLVRSLGLC